MNQPKRLSILIVTYNSENEIENCLRALQGFDESNIEIIIVDNASQDGTVNFLKEKYLNNPQYRTFFNVKNTGFAGGMNQCVELAHGDIVLSINPDTTVTVESVMEMLEYFEKTPGIGILGPKIMNKNGVFQETYGKDLTLWNEVVGKIFESQYLDIIPYIKKVKQNRLKIDKITEVGWIGGACFMMRKDVYLKSGGINQKFFLSHADLIDLSRKVKNLGLKNILYTPVSVTHVGGRSSVGDTDLALRNSYIGSLYYFEIYNGKVTVFFAKILYIIISSIKAVIAFCISLFKNNPYRTIAKTHSKNVIRIIFGRLGKIQ